MNSDSATRFQLLRRNFEGKRAIYVEKGALLVRVQNIRIANGTVSADIEEKTDGGFRAGLYASVGATAPLRWNISTGLQVRFSEFFWHMGYGGWSLFFHPRIVGGVIELAESWPDDLDAFARYDAVMDWLMKNDAYRT